MVAALRRPDPEDDRSLSSMSVEELKQALIECMRMTANGLRDAARYVGELEKRGEDLIALKLPMFNHLRRIACGQVLPEIVVRFAGKPKVLGYISNLPLQDQEAFARGEPVRLLAHEPDGSKTHLLADPLFLSDKQVSQVFAKDHIRTEAEQAAMLEEKRQERLRKKPEQYGKVKLDHELKKAKFGNAWYTLDEIEKVVKLLRA